MTTKRIARSIAIDALASASLDRLARHRGKKRHEVLADVVAEFERVTTKDMTTAEWDAYFGKSASADGPTTRAV